MRQHSLPPLIKTLVASTAYTSTTTTSAFSMPVADSYEVIINATTVTGTSPTCDSQLSTSVDGGTTYITLPLRSTQITAAGKSVMVFKLGLGGNEVALESTAAATGGTLAKNCIFDPKYMKLTHTIGGTNPSFTIVVYGAFLPAGSNSI